MLKKIILVEDDRLDAKLTTRTLHKLPLANKIEWLETGQEFMDYIETKGISEIGLVILDLNMPQITGIEVLEYITNKNHFGKFPIVVLTSSKESPDVKRCYELGVNAFVAKPVDNAEFRQAIRTLGLFWGILNEPPPEL